MADFGDLLREHRPTARSVVSELNLPDVVPPAAQGRRGAAGSGSLIEQSLKDLEAARQTTGLGRMFSGRFREHEALGRLKTLAPLELERQKLDEQMKQFLTEKRLKIADLGRKFFDKIADAKPEERQSIIKFGGEFLGPLFKEVGIELPPTLQKLFTTVPGTATLFAGTMAELFGDDIDRINEVSRQIGGMEPDKALLHIKATRDLLIDEKLPKVQSHLTELMKRLRGDKALLAREGLLDPSGRPTLIPGDRLRPLLQQIFPGPVGEAAIERVFTESQFSGYLADLGIQPGSAAEAAMKAQAAAAMKTQTKMEWGKDGLYAITTDASGEVVAKRKIEGMEAPTGKTVLTPERIEAALAESGWTRDMPGYQKAYLDIAKQTVVPEGGELYGRGAMVPQPPGVDVPKPPGTTPPAPAGTLSTPITPLIERGPSQSALKEYRHKDTLEKPPPGTPPSELRKHYRLIPEVQVSSRAILEANLLEAEAVIRKRQDLFPLPTGNAVMDIANRKLAQGAGWVARQQGDTDMQTLDSLRGMLMQIQRAFGGTSRQMDSVIELLNTERAFHVEPGSAQASREQIRVLRDRLNRGFGGVGLPPMKGSGEADGKTPEARAKGKYGRGGTYGPPAVR